MHAVLGVQCSGAVTFMTAPVCMTLLDSAVRGPIAAGLAAVRLADATTPTRIWTVCLLFHFHPLLFCERCSPTLQLSIEL